MIGVLASPDQAPAVREFFELFKTPWEHFDRGGRYDVVVATVDDVPEVDAPLVVVYRSTPTTIDEPNGLRIRARRRGSMITVHQVLTPVYGPLATFDVPPGARACIPSTSDAVAVEVVSEGRRTVRIGYDLFDQVAHLLSAGQPVSHAEVPTLDLHISILRDLIVNAGVPLLEIPPAPAGHRYIVSLTHDIDFVGIRRHRLDHSMFGFLYRSTVGAVRDFFRGRLPVGRLFQRWRAAAALPFVYAGLAKDFWEPFEWYLRVEKNLPATYFLIPFKHRAGQHVPGSHASRRATAYDVEDIKDSTRMLAEAGSELAVHGLDAWHSAASGRQELDRVAAATGSTSTGIRMHWLLWNESAPEVLERGGYSYDSTAGYNETIGYRNGTSQVFRPAGATSLLELPMHIQDGALFYPQQLDLSEVEAGKRCQPLIEHVRSNGGVLTLLWHDRSHGPERFWGGFYEKLVQRLKVDSPWFATAEDVVDWFRKRREVRFAAAEGDARLLPRHDGEPITPPLTVRVYNSGTPAAAERPTAARAFTDIPWTGRASDLADTLACPQAVGSL